ncbi:hypothetical protein ACE4WU_05075 [Enterococcus faecalis]|uniref:hypothetical protein n=1 Tax=Enterococcus faecalis TaxID=1351 RepID=UPI0035C95945
MNQEEHNHKNVYQNKQSIDHEKHESQVQNKSEESTSVKEPKKKKTPKRKTVYDLDKEIEALKKRRETLLKKQVTELGEKVLEILERHDISFLEINEELELFYSEFEEMIEQNKENLKAVLS